MLCFPDSIVEWVKLIELWFGGLYVVFSVILCAVFKTLGLAL